MLRKLFLPGLIIVIVVVLPLSPAFTDQGTISVEIESTEVTRPDVAVSPNGKWMIFNALGHLFRLPVEGGEAQQLTFGPYFDSDPAISPDGKQVVFSSDRDVKSNGNIFLLELASGDIRQLTREKWAARPVWSPDGESIAYLAYEYAGQMAEYEFVGLGGILTLVRQVSLKNGSTKALTSEPAPVHSIFYLSDSRLAWTMVETESGDQPAQSRIEVLTGPGKIDTLLTVDGVADRVVPAANGDGLYLRRYQSARVGVFVPQLEQIVFLSKDGKKERAITDLNNPQPRPGFSIATGKIYLGDTGRLWSIDIGTGKREEISFSANIKMEVFPRVEAPSFKPDRGQVKKPTIILDPRLSGDGKNLIFTAAGFIWKQPLTRGPAQRLFDDEGFQWGAAALSPDGRKLAYQHSEGNLQELRVVDLESGEISKLVTVDRTGRFEPSWSPDGRKLVYVGFAGKVPSLYLIDLVSGKRSKVINSFPRWMPRPHFSGDGRYLYYTDRNQVYRTTAVESSKPEPITQISGGHLADGTVSPDGNWLAFRRNEEIWTAPLDRLPVTDDAVTRLTDDGGLNYSFAPDSSALIYAAGPKVWQHPLNGVERKDIPVRIEFPSNVPAPTLIRNVRVLDFDVDGFTKATSLFIDKGRIQWIGSEKKHKVPRNVKIVDAEGKFAIPGLFDSHIHTSTPIHFIPARDVSNMAANIAFGVTSVRDMGSDITLVKAWNDRREVYGAPVPRIFSGGAMIETTKPFFHGGSFFAHTAEQARALVRKEQRDGAVVIKSYFTLPWSLQRVIADEARRQAIPIAAHGMVFKETVVGLVLGRGSIEHQNMPSRVYDDVIQLFNKTGTRWGLTIGVGGGNALLFNQEPQLLSCGCLRAFTSQSDYDLAKAETVFSDLKPAAVLKSYTELLVSVKEAHSMGVRLLAGTDALNPNIFYGHAVHMELRHLAQAGISPIDILRTATIEAAEMVGAQDVLGSLTPEKIADIVLLNENPLDDIKNTMDIWRVVQGGRIFASNPEVEER
ncbi:PD40 domain-containing protein [bacterium]|nr:PD40 domain-containing protein [bacterium]